MPKAQVEFDPQLVVKFVEIGKTHKLNDVQLAGISGLAPSTVYVLRATRCVPRSARVRRAVADFVALNGEARTFDQLRIVKIAA